MKARPRQTAFTLLEMLVVVTIMAVLLTIAVPSVAAMLRSHRWSSAQNLVRSSLALAQAHAARTQRYAGIRFQQALTGRQYLVLIEQSAPGSQSYTALANHKPAAMPQNIGAISAEIDLRADRDDYLDDSDDSLYCLKGASTFTIIFSASGQLVTKNIIIDRRHENDQTFGGKIQVESGAANAPLLYSDVHFWGGPEEEEEGPDWCYQEPSTTGLYLYNQDELKSVDPDERYTKFLSQYRSSDAVVRVVINAYTGSVIDMDDF